MIIEIALDALFQDQSVALGDVASRSTMFSGILLMLVFGMLRS